MQRAEYRCGRLGPVVCAACAVSVDVAKAGSSVIHPWAVKRVASSLSGLSRAFVLLSTRSPPDRRHADDDVASPMSLAGGGKLGAGRGRHSYELETFQWHCVEASHEDHHLG